MGDLDFFHEHGYFGDTEPVLRSIADGRNESRAQYSANQIKHLKDSLRELINIVEIHSNATANNFAWAELECARIALNI